MGIFDNLSGLLHQAQSGNASEPEVHAAYDQVSRSVPPETMADGLAHAFRSDQTPPFEQMLAKMFEHSSPDQKAGILNRLMAAAGPAAMSRLLPAMGGAAAGGSVSPQQAQQVPPETVRTVAQEAAQKDPSIMDQAANFYAQHPTLVKSLGVAALAMIMQRTTHSR